MRSTRGAAEPDWPTSVRARKRDGRVQGTDGSVWLYRSVPLAPVADAPDEVTGLEPGGPILTALDELAAMTGTRITRRSTAKSGYRQVHLLLVNVPRRFTPDPRTAGAAHLAELFPDTVVQRRLLLFGVRLRDRITGAGWRGARRLGGGDPGLRHRAAVRLRRRPRRCRPALTRAGLTTPTDDDFRLAAAWWNDGRFADTPILPHADHLHVFTSVSAAHAADAGRPGGLHRLAGDPRPARRHVRRGGAVRPGRHPGHHDEGALGGVAGHRRRAGRVDPRTGGTGEDHPRGAAAPPPAVPAGRHRAVPGREDVRRAAGGDPGRPGVHRGRLRAGRAADTGRLHGAGRPQRPVRRRRRGRRGQRRHSERDAVPAGGGVRRDLAVLTGPRRAAPARPAVAHRRVLRAAVAVHRRRPGRGAARVHREGPATGVPVADRGRRPTTDFRSRRSSGRRDPESRSPCCTLPTSSREPATRR